MIARATALICCTSIAACSGVAPAVVAPAENSAPALVVGGASDGNAVPLAVILNLPQGVSATSVREGANGCFEYLTAGDASASVADASGNPICRS